MKRLAICLACVFVLSEATEANQLTVRVVDLDTHDIVYDSTTRWLYASIPDEGGSIISINPYTGGTGTPVVLGNAPGRMVLCEDGRYLHACVNGNRSVQQFDTMTQTPGVTFDLPGGTYFHSVEDIRAVNGRPKAVVISKRRAGLSPRQAGVVMYEDGLLLPDTSGGANKIAINDAGDVVYGYESELSSFDFIVYGLDQDGIHGIHEYRWGSVLRGYNLGSMRASGDRLFTNRGEVLETNTFANVGSFPAGTYLPDAATGHLYTVTGSGSTRQLNFYHFDTLSIVDSFDIEGVTGSTGSLVRFGDDGLAFRTSSQVFLVRSELVPEPSALVLATLGLLGMLTFALRRRGHSVITFRRR